VDGHLLEQLCHCTCPDWSMKSIHVQQMLWLLFVSHYLRYHARFDRSKTTSLLTKCSCMEEGFLRILALPGQRQRWQKLSRQAITCRGKIVHSIISRCQPNYEYTFKEIHTPLNLEDMFRKIMFNFCDKNTISEFCEWHYINVHMRNSLRVHHWLEKKKYRKCTLLLKFIRTFSSL